MTAIFAYTHSITIDEYGHENKMTSIFAYTHSITIDEYGHESKMISIIVYTHSVTRLKNVCVVTLYNNRPEAGSRKLESCPSNQETVHIITRWPLTMQNLSYVLVTPQKTDGG